MPDTSEAQSDHCAVNSWGLTQPLNAQNMDENVTEKLDPETESQKDTLNTSYN